MKTYVEITLELGHWGKSLTAGILLAHNAQRCYKTSQEMQSLSGARQNLSPPIRATDFSYKPMAFSVVGARHIETFAPWKGPMQVYRRSSGLFHQMGRSRAFGYHHGTKGMQLRLAHINMQVWFPEGLGV